MACGDLSGLPGAPPGRSRLGGRNVTMTTFMATANGGLDRPAIDKTGLTGRYDWWIEYVPDAATDGAYGANFPNPDPMGPKLWTAFKEQLGLEFKPVKADVNWLVFDKIVRPTGN